MVRRAPNNHLEADVIIDSPSDAGTQPLLLYPPYRSTIKRAPSIPLVRLPTTIRDVATPVYGYLPIGASDNDLTSQHPSEPIGERIIVSGRVLDEDGRAIPHTLVEIWQCNAAGRYAHAVDDHPAPLDPNFTGSGRTLTDADVRYQFVTIKPGAYPWRNHPNAWRPAQMYFPNDPLFSQDPIFQSIPDERARQRLVSQFELTLTRPEWALGYRFDIVLRGHDATPFERAR